MREVESPWLRKPLVFIIGISFLGIGVPFLAVLAVAGLIVSIYSSAKELWVECIRDVWIRHTLN